MIYTEQWLLNVHEILETHFNDSNFCIDILANKLHINKRLLYRKMKKVTGLPPKKYIRRYRLQKAKNLLESGQIRSVNDSAAFIGYSNVGYFITQFEKEFGKRPFQLLQERGWR